MYHKYVSQSVGIRSLEDGENFKVIGGSYQCPGVAPRYPKMTAEGQISPQDGHSPYFLPRPYI